MRRLPVAVAGLAMFLTAACGTDGDDEPPASSPTTQGGTASVEEICTGVNQIFEAADADSAAALDAVRQAAESGTEEELAQAQDTYVGQAETAADALRGIAATAEDPELSASIENLADELVTFVNAQAETGEPADPTGVVAAVTEIEGHCG